MIHPFKRIFTKYKILMTLFVLFFFSSLKIVSSEIAVSPLFIVSFAALALIPFESSIIRSFNLVVILDLFSIKSNFSANVFISQFLLLQK